MEDIGGKAGKSLPILPVPIENSEETVKTELYHFAPTLEYQQEDSNICCFKSLASELHVSAIFLLKVLLQSKLKHPWYASLRVILMGKKF